MRLSFLLLALFLGAGCAAISPPPAFLGHGGPRGAPMGSTEVLAGGMAGGGIFVPSMVSGGLRARHQFDEKLALGAQLDGGFSNKTDDGDDDVLTDDVKGLRVTGAGAGRIFAHFHPAAISRVAVGLGGGMASNGLRYGTLDASLLFGSTGEVLRVYGGPLVALSIPVEAGDPIDDKKASAVGYGALAAGLEVSLTDWLAISGELAAGGAVGVKERALVAGAGSALAFRIPGS